MLSRLHQLTGEEFGQHQTNYRLSMASASLALQQSAFFDALTDLHKELRDTFQAESIRSIEAWANGETELRISVKSWESAIDKLYRLNVEENRTQGEPPCVPTIFELARDGELQREYRDQAHQGTDWITPQKIHLFADDLVRTKFVVPFVDGVINVSNRIEQLAELHGHPHYKRYHAKDSGYHARHIYIVMDTVLPGQSESKITLEVKILTKLQDTLGELTHLLYELKRTGQVETKKKRKLAWEIESEDFSASYLGHSAHYLESEIVNLKHKLEKLNRKS